MLLPPKKKNANDLFYRRKSLLGKLKGTARRLKAEGLQCRVPGALRTSRLGGQPLPTFRGGFQASWRAVRRFDKRQVPAVRSAAPTAVLHSGEPRRPRRPSPEVSKHRVQGGGPGEDPRSRVTHLALCSAAGSAARAPAAPPPPPRPGSRTPEREPESWLGGTPGRARGGGRGARPPALYLVDVAVGAAADALNQLEIFLRVPAGQVEAGVHGGPRVPPASLPGREGGALRGPHGECAPRPAPCSPGGHNRPTPRCGRRSPRAAADDDDRPNVPAPRCRAEPGSHPQREGSARSPSLGVKLQHGFRLRRSSPSPHSAPPPSSLSRLPPDCAAAIPEGAFPGSRAHALRLRARPPGWGRAGPRRTRATAGPRSALLAWVCLLQGPRDGQAHSVPFMLLIPLVTKLDALYLVPALNR